MYIGLKASLDRFRDVAFPATCTSCGAENLSEKTLCSNCYEQLSFLSAYKCRKCGYEAENLFDGICGNCKENPPYFECFYGVVEYNDFSSHIISRLKFSDGLYLVPVIGQLMTAELLDIEPNTIITPIPIHWRRRLKRRFNQSAELSRYIAKQKKLRYIGDLAQRMRATKPQVGQSGYKRQLNLKGAFRFNPKYNNLNKGKVVLVDDVLTTGTTLQSVAQILKQQGFEVYALVFARVQGHLR